MGKAGSAGYVSTEVMEYIAKVAGIAAVDAYKAEMEKTERKEKKRRDVVEKTKNMLKSYRAVKRKLQDETMFTIEEQAELRWKFLEDLMGDPLFTSREATSIAETKERTRQEDYYGVYMIENAMRLYEEEVRMTKNEERQRRFREIYSMYIEEEEITVAEIARLESISEKTVYKDLDMATRIVAVYLFGFSAMK